MRVKSATLRKIHKWVGLVIGLQFLLWAVSGLAMALIDMEAMSGGPTVEQPVRPLSATSAWPLIQGQLAGQEIRKLATRPLPTGAALEVTTAEGTRLFDGATGEPLSISAAIAGAIAASNHPAGGSVARVAPMKDLSLAVRDHELPIWRVDFDDAARSAYYVSGTTGELLERRNDSWRWWDFFWMLHNMDYRDRSSFNHPLIVIVTFASAWLVVTGFWLLFRTFRRSDFAWARR